MNLLLLSFGLGALENFLTQGTTIGFIPTAGEVYLDPYWVNDDRKRLQKLGYHVVDLDLSNLSFDQLKKEMKTVNALFVAGGNTFYLMQQIRNRNFENLFRDFIKTEKLYIGSSAGSVIVGPSLEPMRALDKIEKAPLLQSTLGLQLIDSVILPHFGRLEYEKNYQTILDDYQNQFKLLPLNDRQAAHFTSAMDYSIVDSDLILHA